MEDNNNKIEDILWKIRLCEFEDRLGNLIELNAAFIELVNIAKKKEVD